MYLNAGLLARSQCASGRSHPELQNSRQNAVLPMSYKFRHNAAPQTHCSAQILHFFPPLHSQQSTFHHRTSQRFTLPAAYIYQKDERALFGYLRSSELLPFLHPFPVVITNAMPLITPPFLFSPLLSPYSFLIGLEPTSIKRCKRSETVR